MSGNSRSLSTEERDSVQEYIASPGAPRRSSRVVEEIIRLAVASAGRTVARRATRLEIKTNGSCRSGAALEQRLVSLFD